MHRVAVSSEAVTAARQAFPSGLEQPEGRFRFSVDALLLAAFAANGKKVTERFVDLGTGCGVVGLACLLLTRNNSAGFGIDRDAGLIDAAANNAAKLGLSERFAPRVGELADGPFLKGLRREAAPVDLVMANPPWRLLGSGRPPETEARRGALFGDAATFPLFASAASSLLEPGGRFACVIGPERLPDMLSALSAARFGITVLRFVHTTAKAPATFALIEARRGSRAAMTVSAPLFLYGPDRVASPESLEFCPLLG